jgi:hypothetical protein
MYAAETMSTGTAILMYTLFICAWFAFGYWGGAIAKKKGYGFPLGFAVGFIGGILGILVLYIIRDKEIQQGLGKADGRAGGDAEPRRVKVCHQCTKLVEGDAEFCRYCGARV